MPSWEDVALEGVRRLCQSELPLDRAWAPLLRAPEGYLELVRSSRLASLGSLAEIRRGYTTNDNAFFYPGPDQGIESRYLRPLFKSPKDVRSLRFGAGDLAGRVFVCSLTREELRELGDRRALGWVNLHRGGRPASAWALRTQEPLRLFLMKGYHDRFRQPLSDEPLHFDQQIYGLRPKREDDLSFLAAAMNSAWFQLSLELVARVNFGDGRPTAESCKQRSHLPTRNPAVNLVGRHVRVLGGLPPPEPPREGAKMARFWPLLGPGAPPNGSGRPLGSIWTGYGPKRLVLGPFGTILGPIWFQLGAAPMGEAVHRKVCLGLDPQLYIYFNSSGPIWTQRIQKFCG